MFINYLSPSKIHFIHECKFRYVLSLSDINRNRTKTFNRNTFLGILMHSVFEQYLKRKCSISDYEELWYELFTKMIIDYKIDKQDIDIIKYHLPYYEVKKNKLLELIKTFRNINGFELFIEENIRGGIIRGKADIIYDNISEKKVRIIDFKTGPISNYENAIKQDVKGGYKLQLMTYGYIYWLKGYLSKNIICKIQGVSVSEYEEMVFSDEQYKKHEELLLGLKEDINKSHIQGKLEALATPSPKACIFCAYNSSCTALHNIMINNKIDYPTLSLVNQINSEFDDFKSKINIIVKGGMISILKIPKKTYYFLKKTIKKGKSVFILGLFEEDKVGIKYWTRHTEHYEL